MKKQKLWFVIGVILIAGLLIYVSGTEPGKAQKNDTAPKNEHPEEIAENSGHSVPDGSEPLDEETALETSLVEITPEKQQLIGVRIADVKLHPLERVIRTVGRIEYDERKVTTVNIKFEGWIDRLYADYSGKYVKKGEPIADIYSPELVSMQLEFVNLLQWKDEKGHRLQRNVEFRWGDRYGTTGQMLTFDIEALLQVARQKLMLWEITEDQIKNIEKTKEPMKTLTLHSPMSGYVFDKPVVKGTRVSPGDKIVDIVDLSTVWIIADIYEPDLPLIKVGQEARISLSYFPDKKFSSKIDFIYPFLSEKTRTAKVRFSVKNPRTVLKPQMFTTVEIAVSLGNRLAVPESAVLDSGKRQLVYVDRGEGYFEPRVIVTGLRAGGMVEVLRGLKAGERVASAAAFLIDSESRLQGIVQE